MLQVLQKAQADGPETFAAALDELNTQLGFCLDNGTVPPKTVTFQRRFVDAGGAEFCADLLAKGTETQRAWLALCHASIPVDNHLRIFAATGLVQAAVQAMEAAVVPAIYVLANLAGSPQISAKLAMFPGLCEAAVK